MRRTRCERGQVMPLVAVVLVALLGISAFAIDVGYAYYAKRQLQSATDAAALAGAQDLPNIANAVATATNYAGYNTPANLSGKFTFSYQTKCTAQAIAAVACVATTPNDLTVSGTATTDTWFARMFGMDHFNVSTHANACSPCSSTPVDIVIVLDRTGSMCTETDRNGCVDLNFAKEGVRTMLGALNPAYANVGMVAFPPVATTAAADTCLAPYNSLSNKADAKGNNDDTAMDGYDASNRGYLTDQLNHVYKLANGSLDPASGLYKHTVDGNASACIQAGESTSYTEALRQAKKELVARGRANVPDFIVFFTDGEANIGSVYSKSDANFPINGADDQKPCQSAETLANGYKTTDKITIYAIGYDLGDTNCTGGGFHAAKASTSGFSVCTTPSATCWHYRSGVTERTPAGDTITSRETLDDIASDGKFFNQPSPGDLTATFATIAADIGSGASRLVADSY